MLSILLAFSCVFASLGEAKPISRRADPDWLINTDLSKSPSVKDKVTLYRGISNLEELKSTRDRVGKSPEYMSQHAGDFNGDGTDVLYFFDEDDSADIWCDYRVDHSGAQKCAVATYEWNPPADVKIKRWNKANTEWYEYVKANYEAPQGVKSPLQKENDWIEGPVSLKREGGDYEPSGIDMQHALVSSGMLQHLTVKSVGDDRLPNPNGAQPDPNMPVGEMKMFTDFDAEFIRKV